MKQRLLNSCNAIKRQLRNCNRNFSNCNLILASAIMMMVLASCDRIYYRPSQPNMPMFTDKNQGKIGASLSAGEYTSATELQSAVSVSKHVGLLANYNAIDLSSSSENLFEFGGGYFANIKNNWGYEIYGGLGTGNVKDYDNYRYDNHVTNIFIQPDIFYTRKHFDFAFTLRFTRVHFRDMIYDDYMGFQDNQNYFFAEPSMVIAAGWRSFKFKLQSTYSAKLGKNNLTYENFIIGLGFDVNINKHYDKNNRE
ncbi:MAG: hypothetical protein ABI723_16565 [Bacteroidia bacterium]